MKYKIIHSVIENFYQVNFSILKHQKSVQEALCEIEKNHGTIIKTHTMNLDNPKTSNMITEIYYNENPTREVIFEKK